MRELARALMPLALLLSLLTGCIGPDAGQPRADVVATVYPLAFLAERIGGPSIQVDTLLGAGEEAHSWSPTVGDVARLQGAQLVLAQGAGMEPWLDGLLERLGDERPRKVVATDGLTLLEGDHDEHAAEEGNATANGTDGHGEGEDLDPHTWQEADLFAQQARLVEAAMVQAFPDEAANLSARADALVADLEALDEAFRTGLSGCSTPFIVVNHNAFAYAGAAYGFEIESVFGLSPEGEATPREVQRIIDRARAHNVTVVLREDVASPRTLELVADEIGAEVAILHPLGSLTAAQAEAGLGYLDLMEENLEVLREAMACP